MSLNTGGIYQTFLGRNEGAAITTHSGAVLDAMAEFPYGSFIRNSYLNSIYFLGLFDTRGPIVVQEEGGVPLALDSNDRLPSPFAISNHRAINPSLGDREQFEKLVERVHQAGGKVIVDFVPNHTGLACPWISEHPNYYHRDPNSPNHLLCEFSGDVVKLDYTNPELAEAQWKVLENIVELGADAVRVDMAHWIQDSFWTRAIPGIKRLNPQFSFIAEVYADNINDWSQHERLIHAGFDAVYHEQLYRHLKLAFQNDRNFEGLVEHINLLSCYPFKRHLVNYLANHDDPLIAEASQYQAALMTLCFCLPGIPFVCNGQLFGRTTRLKHHVVDLLPDTESEFNHLPIWFQRIASFRRHFEPRIESLHLLEKDILSANCLCKETPCLLLLNLSTSPFYPASYVRSSKPGLINGQNIHNGIEPGQAEIFEI